MNTRWDFSIVLYCARNIVYKLVDVIGNVM